MPPANVITIVVDRLHAGMIGAYGNSWIKTASIDQLASESFLFDQSQTDSPSLAQIYRGYWQGLPITIPATPGKDLPTTLPRLIHAAGIETVLITAEPAVAALDGAADLPQRVCLEPSLDAAEAVDVSETEIAALFGAATEWLARGREPFFLWIHARGMSGPWDCAVGATAAICRRGRSRTATARRGARLSAGRRLRSR